VLATQNRYFATLPASLQLLWAKRLTLKEYAKGELIDLSSPNGCVCFPITAVAAQYIVSPDGDKTLLRFSGRNTALGLGGAGVAIPFHYHGVWCCDGYAFTMPKAVVLAALDKPSYQKSFIDYSQIAIERMSMMMHCAAAHTLRQRLARLLLDVYVAQGTDINKIRLTHEEIALFLNTRRETVSTLVGECTAQQLITSSRGRIDIHRLEGLQQVACSCHANTNLHLERALSFWRSHEWNTNNAAPEIFRPKVLEHENKIQLFDKL
jgi:CRP-like cAMP-binding protein